MKRTLTTEEKVKYTSDYAKKLKAQAESMPYSQRKKSYNCKIKNHEAEKMFVYRGTKSATIHNALLIQLHLLHDDFVLDFFELEEYSNDTLTALINKHRSTSTLFNVPDIENDENILDDLIKNNNNTSSKIENQSKMKILKEQAQKIRKYEMQIESLLAELQTLQQAKNVPDIGYEKENEKDDEIARLQAEIVRITKSKEVAEIENLEKKDECNDLRTALSSYIDKYNDVTDINATLKNENEKLKAEIIELKNTKNNQKIEINNDALTATQQKLREQQHYARLSIMQTALDTTYAYYAQLRLDRTIVLHRILHYTQHNDTYTLYTHNNKVITKDIKASSLLLRVLDHNGLTIDARAAVQFSKNFVKKSGYEPFTITLPQSNNGYKSSLYRTFSDAKKFKVFLNEHDNTTQHALNAYRNALR